MSKEVRGVKPARLTRAQRYSTYSPRVQKIRSAHFWLLIAIWVILATEAFALYWDQVHDYFMSGLYCGSFHDDFPPCAGDQPWKQWRVVQNTLVAIQSVAFGAQLTLGILLFRERKVSKGTKPALRMIIASSLVLLPFAIYLVWYLVDRLR